MAKIAKIIEWRDEDDEGTADLYIDRRIVEYDVPKDERAEALRRARVKEKD